MKASQCSGEGAVETDPLDISDVQATDEERAKWRKKVWVWCTVCGGPGGSLNKSGWSHQSRQGHKCVGLPTKEKEQAGVYREAFLEFLRIERGGAASRKEVAAERRAVEANAVAPQQDAVPAPQPYMLHFGKYKSAKKTIAALYESTDEADSTYIPYLFATRSRSGVQENMAELESALRREGWWEHTEAEAARMTPEIRRKALDKKIQIDDKVAAGEPVHKDVVKEAALAVLKLTQDQAEDERVDQPKSVTVLAPLSDRPEPEKKRPRRMHRSLAQVENHHCGYCGLLGHYAKQNCPLAEREAAMENMGLLPYVRSAELVGVDRELARVRQKLKYTWTDQRTDVYNAKKPRAQSELSMSGHRLCRMTANDAVSYALVEELVVDLEGKPCRNPKCASQKKGWSDVSELGSCVASSEKHHVGVRTACYRCKQCRMRHSVLLQSPGLNVRDSLEEAMYVWWMFVQRGTITLTALHGMQFGDNARSVSGSACLAPPWWRPMSHVSVNTVRWWTGN
jgi:hypothetical protein